MEVDFVDLRNWTNFELFILLQFLMTICKKNSVKNSSISIDTFQKCHDIDMTFLSAPSTFKTNWMRFMTIKMKTEPTKKEEPIQIQTNKHLGKMFGIFLFFIKHFLSIDLPSIASKKVMYIGNLNVCMYVMHIENLPNTKAAATATKTAISLQSQFYYIPYSILFCSVFTFFMWCMHNPTHTCAHQLHAAAWQYIYVVYRAGRQTNK